MECTYKFLFKLFLRILSGGKKRKKKSRLKNENQNKYKIVSMKTWIEEKNPDTRIAY